MCERRLRDFAPDIVVTLEGVNDLVWNGKAGYRYSRAARFAGIDRIRDDLARVDLPSLSWRLASFFIQIVRRLETFERQREVASWIEYTDRGNQAVADGVFPALRDLVEKAARQRGMIPPR
jgi:hypothetical protein